MKIVVEQLFKLMGALDSAPTPIRQEFMEIIKKRHTNISDINGATWMDSQTFFSTFQLNSDKKLSKKFAKKIWEVMKQEKPQGKIVELKPVQSTTVVVATEEADQKETSVTVVANENKEENVANNEAQFFVNIQLLSNLATIAYGREEADIKFEMMLTLIGSDGMNKQDLTQVLSVCLSKNELSSITNKLPEFVDILFGLIDSEHQGVITVQMFKQFYSSFIQNSTVKREKSTQEVKKKTLRKKSSNLVTKWKHFSEWKA